MNSLRMTCLIEVVLLGECVFCGEWIEGESDECEVCSSLEEMGVLDINDDE